MQQNKNLLVKQRMKAVYESDINKDRATVKLQRYAFPLLSDLWNKDCAAAKISVLLTPDLECKDKACAAKDAALMFFCFKTQANADAVKVGAEILNIV